jgi:hypothetical protein
MRLPVAQKNYYKAYNMADIPLSQFGIENVTKIYLQVKTSSLMLITLGATSAYGIFLSTSVFIKQWRANMNASGGPAVYKGIMDLFWQYLFTLVMIGMMPIAISGMEEVFGTIQQLAIDEVKGEPNGAIATLIAETEEMQRRYPDGPSIFYDTLPDLFAYFNIVYVKPALALAVRWLYALFLCGRFLYLLLLEIVYPIAWVSLLHEDTSKWFWGWASNMLVCFLLVPAFLIANKFADTAVITVFDDPFTLIGILAQFFLKLYLLKRAGELVFKLL